MQSLSDIMKKRRTLSEPEVRYFVVQMADIMRYVKSKKIIHREYSSLKSASN
jgi:serine/threonine protein kinase